MYSLIRFLCFWWDKWMRNEKHPNIATKWDMIKATSICTNLSVHIMDETKHLKSGFVCNVHPTMIFVFALLQRPLFCLLSSVFTIEFDPMSYIMRALSLNSWQTWCHNTPKHYPNNEKSCFFFQMELTQNKIHLVKVEWDKSTVFVLHTDSTQMFNVQQKSSLSK